MLARSLLTGFLVSALLGCSEERAMMNVAGSSWIGYEPYYLADALLTLPPSDGNPAPDALRAYRSRIHFTELASAVSVMRHFANGTLDAAMLTLDEALQLQSETGIELCIAQVIDYSDGADALVVDPTRYALALREKHLKVGYEPGSTNAFLLARALEFLDIRETALDSVPVAPNEHVVALQRDELDALITYEPYLSLLTDANYEVVFSSADIPFEIVDLLVVRSEFWRRHGSALRQPLGRLWDFGLGRLRDPDPQALQIIEASTGLDATNIQQSLEGLRLLTFEESRRALDENLAASIDTVGAYLVDQSAIEAVPALSVCP